MTTPRSNGVSFSLITLSSDAIINSLLGYYKVDFNAAFTLAKSVTTDSSVLDSSTEANVPAAISSLAEAAASLATATNDALGL